MLKLGCYRSLSHCLRLLLVPHSSFRVLQPSFVQHFLSLRFASPRSLHFHCSRICAACTYTQTSTQRMLHISCSKPSCTSLTGLRFAPFQSASLKQASVHTLLIILLAGVSHSAALSLCCCHHTDALLCSFILHFTVQH
jgi:hypothetical protein